MRYWWKKKTSNASSLFPSIVYAIEMTDTRTIRNYIDDCIRKWFNISNYESKHLISLLKSTCDSNVTTESRLQIATVQI